MEGSPAGSVLSGQVWILTYDHKHGTDILIYQTEEDADKGAAQLMAQYLTDFGTPEECLEFLKYLEEKDYGTALSKWAEYTGGTEAFNVNPGSIAQEVDHPELEELKRDLEDQAGADDDGGSGS